MSSADRSTKVFRGLQIVWVSLTLVLAIGILSGDLRLAPSGERTAAEVAGPANLDLDDNAAADAHYAGLDLNLIEVRPVPENSSGRPIIVVNFEARNTTEYQLRIPMRQFALIGDSANQAPGQLEVTAIPVDRFEYSEFSDRLVLDPGDAAEATAVFKLLPGTKINLEDWLLQVAEPGRWPATIPLDGSTDARPALKPMAFADPAQSGAVAKLGNARIAVLDTESSLDFRSFRAPRGEHLASFVVEIQAENSGNQAQLDELIASAKDQSFWHLEVGDNRNEAIQVEVRDNSKSSTTFVVVFTYPNGSTDLTLHADHGELKLAELVIETL